jgi:hypothetical protein
MHLNDDGGRAFWRDHADWVVGWHIAHWPGSRPRLWWKFDSPGVRARLGGIGTPLSECGGAYVPQFEFGLPVNWLTRDEQGHFDRGTPIDPNDPPRFESEPTFLRRHGLLTREERAQLRPRDFWPVVIR